MQGPLTRRAALAGSGAVLLSACGAHAQNAKGAEPPAKPGHPASTSTPSVAVAPAFASARAVVPLPFAPGSLKGLSERLITSHHDNNYAGAVKNLAATERQIAGLAHDAPPLVLGALLDKALAYRNSAALHELYFDNLGGPGGAPPPALSTPLARAYGSASDWQQHFQKAALALGGGSGWIVLGFDLVQQDLCTYSATSHAGALVQAAPLLVLDMYEHSYQMDYGAAAAKYVDAFFANIHWDKVSARLERATKAATALRGA